MHPPLVPPILGAQGRGASSTQPQLKPPRRRRPYICKVSDVVEVFGKDVMQTSSFVTTLVVTHRYSDQASEITHYYLHAMETLFNHWKYSSSGRDNIGLPQPGVCRALQPLGGGLRHEARRLHHADDHPGYCDIGGH